MVITSPPARTHGRAPDAFTAAVGGEVDATVTQPFGQPRTAEVAALPGVESLDAITFLFASLLDPEHESATSNIAFAGSRLSTSRLVAGRVADPTNPREFVASREFVATHHSRLGDHYKLVSWTQDQVESGRFGVGDPEGPSVDGVLVGIIDQPETLDSGYTTAIFSRSLFDRSRGQTLRTSARPSCATKIGGARR